jgi:outer membrane receptor protein involved in Fe transport
VRPTDFANIRLAAYRALIRPDFNMRLAKIVLQGGGGNSSLLFGNSQLKTAKAWNYEVNASFFGPTFGLISTSVYYKEISDMFHMLDSASTVGSSMYQGIGITWPVPPSGAYTPSAPYTSPHPTKVWGFEFEHQVNLNFLPGFLKNFVLTYNGSIVRSETYVLSVDTFNVYVKQPTGFPPPYDSITVPITNTRSVERKQSLENQPRFYGNITLGYDIAGFSVRLSLFHQSEYNISFSASGITDRIANSFTRLDLAVKQQITDNFSVMLNLNNLTNTAESTSIVNRNQGWTLLTTSERYGLTGNLGLRLTL